MSNFEIGIHLNTNCANWTEPSLVKRFGGLLEWRDAIYARHRPRPIGA